MKKFGEFTEEEKRATLAKAHATKSAKTAARKASKLRRDFLDADYWADLARKQGLRLPPWGEAATVVNMRAWCHRVGVSQGRLEAWAGCKLVELVARNPLWPARAIAGIILEEVTMEHDKRITDKEKPLTPAM